MANSLSVSTTQTARAPAVPVETLALRAGQVIEARVAGSGQGGTTQLAIGGQLVEAALAVRIQTGVLIQLLVQGAGANTRLTVLPTPPQAQAPQATPPAPGNSPPVSAPQVPVQGANAPPRSVAVSSAISNQTATVQTASGATPQAPPPGNITAAGQVPPLAVVASGKITPGPLTAPQAGQLPTRPGVQAGAATQIEPGTVFRFQIQGTGVNARPVLVPVGPPESASAASRGQPSGQPALPALAPSPPALAVAQTVQNAVLRQDSITALLTSLTGLGARLSELPRPVAQAGARLLAGQLDLNAKPLTGAGLKDAIIRSGILFENTLLKSGAQALPQGDLKSALLNLRNVLRAWLGGDSQPPARNETRPPPPPTSGAHPRTAPPTGTPPAPAVPNAEAGARLLGQAEAALARMRLTQISSLPPEGAARAAQGAASDLNLELPLLLGKEMGIGQFQISREGGKKGGGDRGGEWKMRFSINFSRTGEVGATVSLRGGKTGVMLWAEREETAGVLKERQDELADSLSARGLEPGAIRCRHGHPPQAKRPVGAFMDNCS